MTLLSKINCFRWWAPQTTKTEPQNLHDSCLKGDFNAVKIFIEKGSDVNEADAQGVTPLHSAAGAGYKEIVKLLLKNKAEVDPKLKDGRTPAHFACLNGHEAVAEYLLQNGANPNAQTPSGRTPLHYAAEQGFLTFAKHLIRYGADVDIQTHEKMSALHLAVAKGHKKVALLLLDKKADPNTRNNRNISVLDTALEVTTFMKAATGLEGTTFTKASTLIKRLAEITSAQRVLVYNPETKQKEVYFKENHTTDLYRHEGPIKLRLRSIVVLLASTLFLFIDLGKNLIRIIPDITRVTRDVFVQFARDMKALKLLTGMLKLPISLILNVSKEVVYTIYRIARTPIYEIGLMIASLYALEDAKHARGLMNRLAKTFDEGLVLKATGMKPVGRLESNLIKTKGS